MSAREELKTLLNGTMLTPDLSNSTSVCFKIRDDLWMLAWPGGWPSFSFNPGAFYKFGYFEPVKGDKELEELACKTIKYLRDNSEMFYHEGYGHCDFIGVDEENVPHMYEIVGVKPDWL